MTSKYSTVSTSRAMTGLFMSYPLLIGIALIMAFLVERTMLSLI